MISPLDFAVCRDFYKVWIEKEGRDISAEIYTGETVLAPDLVQGVRFGIIVRDKKVLLASHGRDIGELMEELSRQYSDIGNISYAELELNPHDRKTLNRFLLEEPGARMRISPSTTYNHMSVRDTNEIWVGSAVECNGYSNSGEIHPNIQEFLRVAAHSVRHLE